MLKLLFLPTGKANHLRSSLSIFSKFVAMTGDSIHNRFVHSVEYLILDMSDCYTWSFPEFVPFCPHLYYFSNFKDFNTLAQA